ncbi:hypothetical protein [Aegicerativicinus sediminis]|uniref:hypothetical protein n=1 Tax=Aegicerativicinus sediminis TaxID=2893202 RepID=UPI001E3B07C0|nr:hypothetical protein [Aegicerativicinus sediminis]
MVLNNIEKLIEKYENAETSIKEEKILQEYFSREDVPPHLEVYKPLFNYFTFTRTEQFTKEVPLKTKNTVWYKWLSVAAVAVVMFGVYMSQLAGPTEAEKQEALLAYNQTMEALSMVSNQLEIGKNQLTPLNVMASNLDEGIEMAGMITEFSETTNLIYNP